MIRDTFIDGMSRAPASLVLVTTDADAVIGLLRMRLGPEPAAARRKVGPTTG